MLRWVSERVPEPAATILRRRRHGCMINYGRVHFLQLCGDVHVSSCLKGAKKSACPGAAAPHRVASGLRWRAMVFGGISFRVISFYFRPSARASDINRG